MTGGSDHKRYMSAYDCGDNGDKYFAEFMIKHNFKHAGLYSNVKDVAREVVKTEMRNAYMEFHTLRVRNRGKPISNASIWAYNYGESFVGPIDIKEITQEDRDAEFERFFTLFMKMLDE